MTTRTQARTLAGIAALAAAVRLARLAEIPPGIHVDSAANAYTTWCLLRTGADWHGAAWPILWSESFGESRTTLLYYFMLPFQALGGLNVVTTRLPAALAGTLTVPLLGWVGARMFGPRAGILAAGLLALSPWHLFLSRTGLEPALLPFAAALLLAGALWSEQPWIVEVPRVRPAWVAPVAGASTGIAAYGYLGIRAFFGVAVALACLFSMASLRRGRRPLLGWVAGLLIVAGPLLAAHLADPQIVRRAEELRLWDDQRPFLENAGRVASRYALHFGPDFLVRTGDPFFLHRIPHRGVLSWTAAALAALGAVVLVLRLRRSVGARALAACLLAYPVADSFTRHAGAHLLRSGAGAILFCLLGGVGGAWLLERAATSGGRARWPAALLVAAIALEGGAFLGRYFTTYPRDAKLHTDSNADVLEAWEWVREERLLDEVDAVFCTTGGNGAFRQDFMIALFGLRYDPEAWARSSPRFVVSGGRRLCAGFDRIWFKGFDPTPLRMQELAGNATRERVLFLVRPREATGLGGPVRVFRDPVGTVTLQAHVVEM